MDPFLLLIVMSLATYRLTRLVVTDDFPPIQWVRDRIAGGWRPLTEKEKDVVIGLKTIDGTEHLYVHRARWSPYWLAELVSCPWCASGWISLGVTLAVTFTVGIPAPVLVWPAVWALGAVLAAQEWA